MNVRYKIRTKRDKNVQVGTVYTEGQVQPKFPILYVYMIQKLELLELTKKVQ